MLSPVYLRKELTTDAMTLRALERGNLRPLPQNHDVAIYRDAAATEPVGRFPWFYASKPDKRRNRITLNCVTRPVVWLEGLPIA